MALLDDRLQSACDADAVAAHDAERLGGVLVLVDGVESLGVLGAELEHLPHFNAAADGDLPAALGADVAFADDDEIGVAGDLRVALQIDVLEVVIVLVGADDASRRAFELQVGDDADVALERLDGADRTDAGAGHVAHGRVIGHLHRLGAQITLELHFVDVAVAGNADHHRLAVGHVDERLDERAAFKPHERGYLVDRLGARRMHFFRRSLDLRASSFADALGFFGVGRVAAAVAEGDRVLAGIGERVEFVRHRVAHVAAVGLHRRRLEPAARENALVGAVHRPIRLVGCLGVGVEAVSVLHDELLRAHQSETRTRLVAEFRLDLIDVERQLAVGRNDVRHEVGHFLLGGRTHRHIALGAVFEAEHVRAHRVPAPGLLPKLGGLQRGHENLARAGGVHLLTHYLLDFLERAHPQRHESEKPRSRLAADPGAHQELVRIDFGVLRIVTQGLNKRFCPFHGRILYQIDR